MADAEYRVNKCPGLAIPSVEFIPSRGSAPATAQLARTGVTEWMGTVCP
ncbi:hypothetical protein M2272_000142 [Mycobacterium frederiksbergense]|uniref:Uncharacterized protein n=1 Tax=Mycolicibacterium frederiksbergense TaxID=117567 RepID=A0ABT6KS21_9MYCO|nr:hypothetical protein [Mycolicibacterium frederiksbergense]